MGVTGLLSSAWPARLGFIRGLEQVLTEASAQTLVETDELEIAAQLQPAVGSKRFTTKFESEDPT